MAEKKEKVIFCNGVFDLLHPGHIQLLKFAKSLGDVLVVSIDTDDCAYKWKGKYPVMNCWERRIMLEAIKYVDEVIVHQDDEELIEYIKRIKPACIVKGPDYASKKVVGSEYAPVIIFQDSDTHISSSMIINRMKQR